jgi:hypothetical protein
MVTPRARRLAAALLLLYCCFTAAVAVRAAARVWGAHSARELATNARVPVHLVPLSVARACWQGGTARLSLNRALTEP